MPYFDPVVEYLRPWKLSSLACGIVLLVLGTLYTGLPDWDVPISLIMAVPAYFTAPCSLRMVLERRWAHFPVALFCTWFTVDGTYAIYWFLRAPAVLEALRHSNAAASMALYGMCSLVWYPKASLREIVRSAVKSPA